MIELCCGENDLISLYPRLSGRETRRFTFSRLNLLPEVRSRGNNKGIILSA